METVRWLIVIVIEHGHGSFGFFYWDWVRKPSPHPNMLDLLLFTSEFATAHYILRCCAGTWLCGCVAVCLCYCVCETFLLLRMARTEPAKPTAIFDYDRCMGILCLLTNDAHNHSHHAISLCVCLCAMFSHTT